MIVITRKSVISSGLDLLGIIKIIEGEKILNFLMKLRLIGKNKWAIFDFGKWLLTRMVKGFFSFKEGIN